jgi:uncharacterized membrane protein YfcA
VSRDGLDQRMTNSILTVLIGLFTGFASGLLGIGGSALGTPLLRLLLAVPPLIALATPMPVMLPSAISGGFAYLRDKKVDFKLAGWMLLIAVPMTWIGATVTAYLSPVFLMVLTAIFLMLVGISFIIRGFILKPVEHPIPREGSVNIAKALFFGAIGGFLAGLLAIGGGVIYVPVILRIFGRSMKVALATSLAVVTAVAIPGTIRHQMLGHIDWTIVSLLSIAVIPASFLGAKLALRLHNRTLERIFGICTIVFGLYFLFTQI